MCRPLTPKFLALRAFTKSLLLLWAILAGYGLPVLEQQAYGSFDGEHSQFAVRSSPALVVQLAEGSRPKFVKHKIWAWLEPTPSLEGQAVLETWGRPPDRAARPSGAARLRVARAPPEAG